MTVSRTLEVTCNECLETKRWDLSVLRDRRKDSFLKNAGYTIETTGLLSGNNHYCSNCNDRTRDTFYVYDSDGYVGEVEAWGIVDARQVAFDEYGADMMVKREKQE